MMYAIKNSRFVQGLESFWLRHGSKVKKALKITGAVGLTALGVVATILAAGITLDAAHNATWGS